jgi:hypothetical protein
MSRGYIQEMNLIHQGTGLVSSKSQKSIDDSSSDDDADVRKEAEDYKRRHNLKVSQMVSDINMIKSNKKNLFIDINKNKIMEGDELQKIMMGHLDHSPNFRDRKFRRMSRAQAHHR